ncbi:MAG TPA: MarR family transcriptional regulator [Streptosporangiaceae bacterium]
MTGSNPDLEGAASALNSGAIHVLRSLRAVDRLAGLTPQRLSALSVLVFGGPCSLGALARAEGVAGPTMTRIADGLIDAGLAEREPHPTDGRAVLIAATAEGDALMRAAQHRRIDALADAIGSLPAPAQRQLVASVDLLDQVAAAVRTQTAPSESGGRPAASAAGTAVERGSIRHRQRTSERQARLDTARARWAEAADQMSAAAQRARGNA